MTDGVRPGWHRDPAGRFEVRYHNGRTWTADVASQGRRHVDPCGASIGETATGRADGERAPTPAGEPRPDSTGRATGSGTVRNGAAVASMVLGITSVAVGWLPLLVVIGLVSAPLAIVLGVVGHRRARRTGIGRSTATVGLVTGLLGIATCVVGVVLTLWVRDLVRRYDEPNPHSVAIENCSRSGRTATAIGRLTNDGDDNGDFVVRIAFVRSGTDNLAAGATAELNDVAPGGTATFEVTRAVDVGDVECVVDDVSGPFPLGIDLGR